MRDPLNKIAGIIAIAHDNKKKSTQQISAGCPSSLRARGAGEDTHKDVRFFKDLSYKLMFEFCLFLLFSVISSLEEDTWSSVNKTQVGIRNL